MPTCDTLPLNEARASSATGQRAALLQEYMGYIQRVAQGQAGKLEPEAGENDPGDQAQACRGGGSVGEGTADPPHRQRRLLLDAGDPALRQALQEPAA